MAEDDNKLFCNIFLGYIRYSLLYLILLLLVVGCTRKTGVLFLPTEPIVDVVIHSASGYIGPCEPSICISPSDQNHIIAGSVLDNVYTSHNGGKTWTIDKITSTYGVYGDPAIEMDSKGNSYFAHLSNPDGKAYGSVSFLDRIVVQKLDIKGNRWSNGTSPIGDTIKDQDKHWLVHGQNDELLMAWTEFDKYGSRDTNNHSRILFSVSTNGAQSWSPPVKISDIEGDCLDDDNTTEGATPAVGVDGTYYVTWGYNDKIYLDHSFDKGKTWSSHDKIIAHQYGGWSYTIEGLGRCNGMPVTCVDHSNSPYRGTIYVNWSDQRNGPNDTDIWLIKSKDDGRTWSKPKRVNNDKGHTQQFMSWMDVDPNTGYIYIVYYDRQKHDDNITDVTLAYSRDGGKTFKNTMINKSSFLPVEAVFFGDYNDISASHGSIRPIWTQYNDGVFSIHTALINDNILK